MYWFQQKVKHSDEGGSRLSGQGQKRSLDADENPSEEEIPDGRGVLVSMLRVGVDGTDKEINAAEYGVAPPGYDFLVIGQESLGIVQIGPNATQFALADYADGSPSEKGHR
jgi:threonine dehydrogenase-like Zn-dependent dehydrogenase